MVTELAQAIAANAPLTLQAFKAAKIQHAKPADQRDLGHVGRLVDACFASSDYTEGRAAFQARRKPEFTGT